MPTEIQHLSWPRIMAGENVLISAPTGSGKTLTAFLSAINSLVSGQTSTGGLRVLYISPLKALNNDIRRNLLGPLDELQNRFAEAKEMFPAIHVAVRSGDTPDFERRKMMRHPPEILITTPESLNILLTSNSGRRIFEGLTTVILDEIHSVASSKRGVHLMTGVERLELLCPGFQRIALSATVRPMERIAAFVGGYSRTGAGQYVPRRVELIESSARKGYELEVDFPVFSEDSGTDPGAQSDWPEDILFGSIVQRLKQVIKSNQSTLIFTNSRRMAEKISMLINEGEERILAYCHHGALSREIRSVVEQDLKDGRLPAVVATASLELGIDIGDLDQVVLIQSPGFLSTTLQRLGRAGHSVGAISRGLFLPLHGRDLLQSAILATSVENREIEEIHPIQGALDILSQIILSMLCSEEWNSNELLEFLRSTYSYHDLPENQYQSVLEMLSGRFATSRIRELRPRIHKDPIQNTLKAAKGVPFLIYMNGGTIPDRGYYGLRHLDTKSRIGELDEEFVWERTIGDTFTLGNQSWRIMEINHNDVLVRPAPSDAASMAPFWRADAQDRDAFVSEKLARFLESREDQIKEEGFCEDLQKDYFLTSGAASYLQQFLILQKERTGVLPHRHQLLIEHYEDPMNRTDRKMVILHTLWGGQVNRPFALAIRGAFLKELNLTIQTMSDDDCVMVLLPHDFDRHVFDYVRSDNLESLLRIVLSSTGFFGALFRQSAGTAMLLPGKVRNRTPLWLNRLRSKKLLEATASYPDFPITLETWRSSLADSFDLITLNHRLAEVESGQIKVKEVFTRSPSPFARNLIWQQTNTFMYQDDRPELKGKGPAEDFFKDLARSSGLRPSIPEAVIQRYCSRMQRTSPGYEPENIEDLLELIRDRILIRPDEYEFYLGFLQKSEQEKALNRLNESVVSVEIQQSQRWICALEVLPLLSLATELDLNPQTSDGNPLSAASENALIRLKKEALKGLAADDIPDPDDILLSLLQSFLPFRGPILRAELQQIFPSNRLPGVLERMLEDGKLIEGQIRKQEDHQESGSALELCDSETLEILLRMTRQHFRPDFQPLPIKELQLFLADFQGLTRRGHELEDLQSRMEQLIGFPLKANLWETEILPARFNPYHTAWLDSLAEFGLFWMGWPGEIITFQMERDLEILKDSHMNQPDRDDALKSLFPHEKGRFSFFDLQKETGKSAQDLTKELWELTWKGLVTNDSMSSLRKGIDHRFQAPALSSGSQRVSRARWSGGLTSAGNWRAITGQPAESGVSLRLEQEERNKEKIHILLARYGILFRELLLRELPPLQWKEIVTTLRRMELSGEVLGGHFFQGIQSLQFMSPGAFRSLAEGLPQEAIYWMNVMDPASLCGMSLAGLALSRRVAGNHLVFHGSSLVLESRRKGKDLKIHVASGHPDIPKYLFVFSEFLGRQRNPPGRVEVETINEQNAMDSIYRQDMENCGFVSSYRSLTLRRKY